MTYQEFIQTKQKSHVNTGIDVGDDDICPHLFDFQKYIVRRALEKGRYAIFAECGLGKTLMQLSWADAIYKTERTNVLILCPLAVSMQTVAEGRKFGIDVCKYGSGDSPIQVTNYEQIDNIDIAKFDAIVLDESSILKNFAGKLKTKIVECFQNYRFKLCCTATPSPNDETEICNHAEFLNVSSRLEVLSTFFVNDTGDTGTWRLKKHAESDFYGWMASWATMISSPSDIGFDGSGYVLPRLTYNTHEVITDKRENGMLFNDIAVNASSFNQELRNTMHQRIAISSDIVNNSDEQWIVWCNLNEESKLLSQSIPDAVEVSGSMSADDKEERLMGFACGKYRVLVTKKEIAQFGLNFQNCSHQIFASLDFSFEGLYQAVRRSYRFGQTKEVSIHLITTDTMQNVIESIKTKEDKFNKMKDKMASSVSSSRSIQSTEKTRVVESELFTLIEGDCVEASKSIPDESVGMMIFSPPFAELYVYSDSPNDMGNVSSYHEFESHFQYLIPELERMLKSGRICAVHCTDLPLAKWKDGVIGKRDFSGLLIKMFEDAGFVYHSRITIWKDPVVEMQRTKALGLLYKQLQKDSTMSRVGQPDYLLVFRKKGDNAVPVVQKISVDLWQQWASPVWMDINQTKTLQKQSARDHKDEKHICPLQLDVIERAVLLWSNEGDTVFSPFAGIGSELYQSILSGRKALGIELKKSYFSQAHKNCMQAELQIKQQEKMDL
jgi:DNA modification methylase